MIGMKGGGVKPAGLSLSPVVLAPPPGHGGSRLVHFARMRRAARVAGLAAVDVAAVVLLAGPCWDATRGAPAPPSAELSARPTTPPASAPATTVPEVAETFEIAAFDVAAIEGPTEPFEPVRAQVGGLLDRYLAQAVVLPLRAGVGAGDLSPLFTGAAAARAAGADRASLVDDGVGKADALRVERATASVVVLVDSGGEAVTLANVSLVVEAIVRGQRLTIDRSGEIFFDREGDAWKISGYDIRVRRDTADGSSTTAVKR